MTRSLTQTLLADAGYFSAATVEACAAAGIEPLIALDVLNQTSVRQAARQARR